MTWSDLTPEQRGQRRAEIHRVLTNEGKRTATALMHRLALDLGVINHALEAMVQSGAVVAIHDNGLTFYDVPRPRPGA